MKKLTYVVTTAFAILSLVLSPMVAMAADTSIATLNVSGNVPVVFSVTARGYPGDLELAPGSIVNDRLLGILHFRYNVDIDTLQIASTGAIAKPSRDGATTGEYPFTSFDIYLGKSGGCSAVAAPATAVAVDVPVDIAYDAGTAPITAGVETDCKLTASWVSPAGTLPLAGVYSMILTVTMVSL